MNYRRLLFGRRICPIEPLPRGSEQLTIGLRAASFGGLSHFPTRIGFSRKLIYKQ